MATKYRDTKGISRLALTSHELTKVVDQFVRLNALPDLSPDDIEKLRWLAVGLFHSPRGLPTSAWVSANQIAKRRHLAVYFTLIDSDRGFEDADLQRAAANWYLHTMRNTAQEAVDPTDPTPTQQSVAA